MIEEFRQEVWKHIKKERFATENLARSEGEPIPVLARDDAKRIVIAVLREVVAPMINRSDIPDETISVRLMDGDREVIEVPARKFKSKEKLLGIRLCKAFSVIDPGYEYNDVSSKEQLNNPNSILFGDTMVEKGAENQAMFPSRVLYSSSYSIRNKIDLTRKLTHNALSAQGTMWDREKGENRKSFFETEYIIPGTVFPSFMTLKDPTPEMLYHFLTTLRETTYGAQTSITGPNVKNHIVAILACDVEPPITSYTVSRDFQFPSGIRDQTTIPSSEIIRLLSEYVNRNLKEFSDTYNACLISGEALDSFLGYFKGLNEEKMQEIYDKLKEDASGLWNRSGFGDRPKKPGKGKGKADASEVPVA